MEDKASTGIINFINNNLKEGIIFLDNTCPKCGNQLNLITKPLNNTYIAVRYECFKCKYICPIKYDIKGNICNQNYCDEVKPYPIYDVSINNFLKTFGE